MADKKDSPENEGLLSSLDFDTSDVDKQIDELLKIKDEKLAKAIAKVSDEDIQKMINILEKKDYKVIFRGMSKEVVNNYMIELGLKDARVGVATKAFKEFCIKKFDIIVAQNRDITEEDLNQLKNEWDKEENNKKYDFKYYQTQLKNFNNPKEKKQA